MPYSAIEVVANVGSLRPELVFLGLRENKLTGSFPVCRRCRQLKFLLCSSNMLEGTLPANVMTSYLEILDASGKGGHVSGLVGQLPPQAKQAFALQHFTVSHQNLEGCIPPLTATLSTLAFHSNRFSVFQSAHWKSDGSAMVWISAERCVTEATL